MTASMVLEWIALICVSGVFVFGACAFFRKGKPLYFQLLVCASGCCALHRLWSVVSLLCGFSGTLNVGLFGLAGCLFFLLSANYGTLDRLVDEGKGINRRQRIAAWIAPFVLVLAIIALFIAGRDRIGACVVLLLACLPALPSAYFSMKHLLLPDDEVGILCATRLCNVCILLFCVASVVYLFAVLLALPLLSGICTLAMAFIMAGLLHFCRMGVKAWETLI